jgi:geranylgeranyl pyrophosphate synthase
MLTLPVLRGFSRNAKQDSEASESERRNETKSSVEKLISLVFR